MFFWNNNIFISLQYVHYTISLIYNISRQRDIWEIWLILKPKPYDISNVHYHIFTFSFQLKLLEIDLGVSSS